MLTWAQPLSMFKTPGPKPKEWRCPQWADLPPSVNSVKKIFHGHAHRPALSRQPLIENLFLDDSRLCAIKMKTTTLGKPYSIWNIFMSQYATLDSSQSKDGTVSQEDVLRRQEAE